jgi:HSF-type DNA-binding
VSIIYRSFYLSVIYVGNLIYNACIVGWSGCYQIPKASVLCKIASAKEAERALQRISERQESTENVSEEHDMVDQESPSDETKDTVVPIDEMTIENVRDLNPQSLRKYLKSYGQKKIPHGSTLRRNLLVSLVEENRKQRQQKDPLFFLASVAAKENELSVQDSAALEHFADVALCTPSLPPEVTRIAKESIKMADIMVEDDLPPFAPSFQHLYFDLRGTSNFPTELYRLVQKAEALVLSHIISWQAKGKSFVVHDRDAFEQKILKECCDGDDSTYEGFGKNLRKFGFVEIQDGSRKGGFRHEYFRRKSHGDVALIEAVEEVPLDDFESGEELASTEQDAPKSSSKRKERRCPAAKAQNAQQLSGSKKFNLSGSDVFPVELHRLLENSKDQGLSNIIGWTPGGSVFAISDEEMFVKRVLARHSKKPLISSFEASLLAFGFKKTRKTSNDRRYQHPNFKKGRPELALLIKTIFEPVASSKKANAIPMTASEGKNRNGSERKRKRHPENDSNDSQKPAQPEAPLPFLGKRDFVDSLRLLLDMKTNSEYVKWLSDGSAFSVTDPDEFEKKVIPQ